MAAGLLGRKIGMTQVLNPAGDFWPVTVVQIKDGVVTKLIDREKHGYQAVQIGFENAKEKHVTKPSQGNFKKTNTVLKRELREFRIENDEEFKKYAVGQEIKADLFEEGDYVDVQGLTVGKGFQGMVRRWHKARGPETHGSMSHRQVGSIGASSFPSRVFRGHHMPGHMGNRLRTVQNLLIVKVLKDENVILVKGSFPGFEPALVRITKAKKKGKIDIAAKFSVKKTQEKAVAAAGKKVAKKK